MQMSKPEMDKPEMDKPEMARRVTEVPIVDRY